MNWFNGMKLVDSTEYQSTFIERTWDIKIVFVSYILHSIILYRDKWAIVTAAVASTHLLRFLFVINWKVGGWEFDFTRMKDQHTKLKPITVFRVLFNIREVKLQGEAKQIIYLPNVDNRLTGVIFASLSTNFNCCYCKAMTGHYLTSWYIETPGTP
jgi:hypothetical protein